MQMTILDTTNTLHLVGIIIKILHLLLLLLLLVVPMHICPSLKTSSQTISSFYQILINNNQDYKDKYHILFSSQ